MNWEVDISARVNDVLDARLVEHCIPNMTHRGMIEVSQDMLLGYGSSTFSYPYQTGCHLEVVILFKTMYMLMVFH